MNADVNVDRFKREILLTATFQHPHIFPVIGAGESAGPPYYTMPVVEGESLREQLARQGQLPIGEMIAIPRDVTKALATCTSTALCIETSSLAMFSSPTIPRPYKLRAR